MILLATIKAFHFVLFSRFGSSSTFRPVTKRYPPVNSPSHVKVFSVWFIFFLKGLSRDGNHRQPSFSISLFSYPHGSLSKHTNRQSKVTKKTGEQQRNIEHRNRERKAATKPQNQEETRESRRLQKTERMKRRRGRDCPENEAAALKRGEGRGSLTNGPVANPNRPGIP
ncbi:hypothetical protein M9H77_28215 [Catharanthus roseus]|uniref:Uncharacterized protein n=1 Tax=Catharanthus roseus TaxID=4058 RepID=A0ACC0AG47_CATRO|nr:hypothetical protein M9H77_28215 [Catharanthus roseus]